MRFLPLLLFLKLLEVKNLCDGGETSLVIISNVECRKQFQSGVAGIVFIIPGGEVGS